MTPNQWLQLRSVLENLGGFLMKWIFAMPTFGRFLFVKGSTYLQKRHHATAAPPQLSRHSWGLAEPARSPGDQHIDLCALGKCKNDGKGWGWRANLYRVNITLHNYTCLCLLYAYTYIQCECVRVWKGICSACNYIHMYVYVIHTQGEHRESERVPCSRHASRYGTPRQWHQPWEITKVPKAFYKHGITGKTYHRKNHMFLGYVFSNFLINLG